MNEQKNEELKKKVDEAWKNSAVNNNVNGAPNASQAMPEISFGLFVSGLMMEALIALGELEHPITKKKDANTVHAKFIIDTLAMLKEKTRNNLSKDEDASLDAILYDLRMRFVKKAGK